MDAGLIFGGACIGECIARISFPSPTDYHVIQKLHVYENHDIGRDIETHKQAPLTKTNIFNSHHFTETVKHIVWLHMTPNTNMSWVGAGVRTENSYTKNPFSPCTNTEQ